MKTKELLLLFLTVFSLSFQSCIDDIDPWVPKDSDGDGIFDFIDNCPETKNPNQEDSDYDGIGDVCDKNIAQDSDYDGIPDTKDNCPKIYNPDQADSDKDGKGDVCDNDTPTGTKDMDNDGVPDNKDNCPSIFNPSQKDTDRDGKGDACDNDDPMGGTDSDKDGVPDDKDNCPKTYNPLQKDSDGDGKGDACDSPEPGGSDRDKDGVMDKDDNCPTVYNPSQRDSDRDGIGDACDKNDGGGGGNPIMDADNDGVPDGKDNCPQTPNPNQADSDGDGIGDVCDKNETKDFDKDGIPDDKDNCPKNYNPTQTDSDGDGIGDACDTAEVKDYDKDGVPDERDNCPKTYNPDQTDSDGDGKGDKCDNDGGGGGGNSTPKARCSGGRAGSYPCDGYDLYGEFSLRQLNASSGSDCWGWTDKASGREFAIMCTNINTVFVEVTDPGKPVIKGTLRSATGSSTWRDAKVYNDHAFIVSEASGHGMQVFNLKRLLDNRSNQTFSADTRYSEFGNSHNIVINEEKAYAYAVGTRTYSGGPHIVDISTPTRPRKVGGYSNGRYSHDGLVVTYNGPDSSYRGKQIYIGSNESKVEVVDISSPSNPRKISSISYQYVKYTHQGWFTEDHRYFLLGDELDEQGYGFNTRTLVFDMQDLDNPKLVHEYKGTTAATDHNGYVKGNKFYLANYTAGLRVLDVSTPTRIREVGHFDSYPSGNRSNMEGAWSVYPYFKSGTVLISDTRRGLIIVRPSKGR